MQWNSQSDQQDLVSDITFHTGVDTNTYSLKARARAANEWQRIVWTWIFEAYGGWKMVDVNTSSSADAAIYAEQTLTSGTGLYAIPTAAVTIDFIEVKDAAGNYHKLRPMTMEEFIARGGDAAFTSTGTPEWYLPTGDVFRILPTPNYTVASTGIRVYFDQEFAIFLSTDTTKVPGFDPIFHRALSIGASIDWCRVRAKDKLPGLLQAMGDYERRIKSFYSKRYKEHFPPRILPGEDLVKEFS